MPYLTQANKTQLWEEKKLRTPGELNYMITTLVQGYIEDKGESYTTYNDIVGALECAKLELYRRKISTYENAKIVENGDVY